VAFEIAREEAEGIVVEESPRRRPCAKLLRKYNASWMFDLHSDVPSEYDLAKGWYSDLIRRPYPLARVVYGGKVWDPEAKMCRPIRNWVGVLLNDFQKEKYGTEDAIVLSAAYPPVRLHERNLTFGLLFVRPLNQSVELVKSLAQYLYSRSV
jgi:hypothetical protein